jgi:toxin ParE1/3/4
VLGDAIEAAVDRLADYPESGRFGRVRGTYELVIVRTPLIMVYRIESDTITILRVLHGAQRWPPLEH